MTEEPHGPRRLGLRQELPDFFAGIHCRQLKAQGRARRQAPAARELKLQPECEASSCRFQPAGVGARVGNYNREKIAVADPVRAPKPPERGVCRHRDGVGILGRPGA